MTAKRLPKLPDLLQRKLYKSGQTRGATIQEIYQNRVKRNSTVLIPWDFWSQCKDPNDGVGAYENGYIVLINPDWYLSCSDADDLLRAEGVALGVNAILHFEKRSQWEASGLILGGLLPNGKRVSEPTSRTAPIGGTILARLHSTTAQDGQRVDIGYSTKDLRGAGIRVYEYASDRTIETAKLQLESYYWLAADSIETSVANGMSRTAAETRREAIIDQASACGLLDFQRLVDLRILNEELRPVCPLCLEIIPASLFYRRGEQAEGRETWDITITEVSLFHIEELRVGSLQHRPYNLGWGHHYCNVVAKDAGIIPTLEWMDLVVSRNANYLTQNH